MKQLGQRKNPSKVNMVWLVAAALFVLGGTTIYAKYYAQSAQKGIAIASGAYLTANYATATAADSSDYVESIVMSDYAGGSASFDFEVRNYENNLLFNSSGILVTYKVSFWLGEAPENAVYKVTNRNGSNTEARTLQAGEERAVTFDLQTLPGGTTNKNTYTINIDATNVGTMHMPVPIFVVVETLDTSMVQKTLKGKMTLAQVTLPEQFIEASEFQVPAEVSEGTDTEKLAELAKLSGLTYEIRTVGSVLASEEVTEEIKVAWRADLLELDRNDNNYLSWAETTGNSGPLTETIDDIEWNYITLDIMPYSAEEIIFYRTSAFENNNPVTMEELNGFVKTEKYTVQP